MNFLCLEKFIPEDLSTIIKDLPFEAAELGSEISNFKFVDPNYEQIFSSILGTSVSLPKNWGGFRKSSPTIHFDDHCEKTIFSAVIALEDICFKTYKHKETGATTVYDLKQELVSKFVSDNCNNFENWVIENQILIKKHSLFFFEPWYWHSFSEGIIQRFSVERPSETNKIDETPQA